MPLHEAATEPTSWANYLLQNVRVLDASLEGPCTFPVPRDHVPFSICQHIRQASVDHPWAVVQLNVNASSSEPTRVHEKVLQEKSEHVCPPAFDLACVRVQNYHINCAASAAEPQESLLLCRTCPRELFETQSPTWFSITSLTHTGTIQPEPSDTAAWPSSKNVKLRIMTFLVWSKVFLLPLGASMLANTKAF